MKRGEACIRLGMKPRSLGQWYSDVQNSKLTKYSYVMVAIASGYHDPNRKTTKGTLMLLYYFRLLPLRFLLRFFPPGGGPSSEPE